MGKIKTIVHFSATLYKSITINRHTAEIQSYSNNFIAAVSVRSDIYKVSDAHGFPIDLRVFQSKKYNFNKYTLEK